MTHPQAASSLAEAQPRNTHCACVREDASRPDHPLADRGRVKCQIAPDPDRALPVQYQSQRVRAKRTGHEIGGHTRGDLRYNDISVPVTVNPPGSAGD